MTVEDLIARHGTAVHTRIARIVGLEDADDVAQLVWVSVWRKMDGFRGEAQWSSWLYRIATNHAISHLRARKSRPIVAMAVPDWDDDATNLRDAQFHDRAATPERRCVAKSELDAVRTRLRRLTPAQRQALAGVIAGEQVRQLAVRFGVPTATMKTRVWRARQMLGRRAAA